MALVRTTAPDFCRHKRQSAENAGIEFPGDQYRRNLRVPAHLQDRDIFFGLESRFAHDGARESIGVRSI